MKIKRIEFSEYGEIAAIEFEEANAHDVMTFLVEYKIRAGASEMLKNAVEARRIHLKMNTEVGVIVRSDDTP